MNDDMINKEDTLLTQGQGVKQQSLIMSKDNQESS